MSRRIAQNYTGFALLFVGSVLLSVPAASAREVEYQGQEIEVFVVPKEPSILKFDRTVASGYKPTRSSLSVQREGTDLVLFAKETLGPLGEAIIVRLEDGRSYSIRVRRANEEMPRDPELKVLDKRESVLGEDEEEGEVPLHKDRNFPEAPSNTVSGLMRDMILVAEFGKKSISGYRASDRYRGQTVLNDGTLHAVLDRVFIGPNLWGYVIDVKNLLDEGQKLNPATFRLDGARAISLERWELAPRPLNIEQQVSGKHNSKVYIVTRSRK